MIKKKQKKQFSVRDLTQIFLLLFVVSVVAGYGISGKMKEDISLGTVLRVLTTPQGGTGTSTIPSAGSLLIGNGTNSRYDVATLTEGSNITITNADGSITIASSGAGGGVAVPNTKWASTTNAIYPNAGATTDVLIGATATSTTAKLEVVGTGDLTGLLTLQNGLLSQASSTVVGDLTSSASVFTGTKNLTNYADYFNGSLLETFNATTTSDGSIVTMTLADSASYTGGVTMRFSTGDVNLNTPTTTTLTAGTDASPTENFVYIPVDTQAITVSTSGWPSSTEHIKIAYFFVPSAGFVQTNAVYINQNWNDHAMNDDNQGHMTHEAERERRTQAQYFSGIDGNGTDGYLTPTAGNTELISTSGFVYQVHKHAFPAFDTSAGDVVLVKNWSGDAYHDITNLYEIVDDSTGTTIGNNKYFNLVVWGVANKTGQTEEMIVNLPSGSYNSQTAAENDTSGFDDLTIPDEFKYESSTGFLIARITIKMKTGGGTWVVASTVDLRGLTPQTATGGTAAGELVNFADNQFTIFNVTDVTKILDFDISGVTTGNTRTITMADRDLDLANPIFTNSSTTNATTTNFAILGLSSAVLAVNASGTVTASTTVDSAFIADAYLLNSTSDTMLGTLTADGLTLGVNENITLGAQTLDHDGSTFVFSDSIDIGSSNFDADGTITSTGIVNFGGATTEISNGAAVFTNTIGQIAIDTTTGMLLWNYGSGTSTKPFYETTGFSYGSTTQGSGTTTRYLAPAAAALTFNTVQCDFSNFMGISLYDGTNRADYLEASSTIGTVTYSTNNVFTAGESIRIDIGTSTDIAAEVVGGCRFKYVFTAD